MERPIADLIERRVAGDDDRQRVGRLIAASRAGNTSKAYRGRIRDYDRWCQSRGLDIDKCLTDEHLSAYIAERHAAGMRAKTLVTAVAALRFACKNSGLPNPGGHLTISTLNGAKRIDASRSKPPPPALRRDQVEKVLQKIDAHVANARAGTAEEVMGFRDAAMIALGSDCMLRVSELAAVDVEHLRVEDDGSGRLHVLSSKTDQTGKGDVLYVPPPTVQRLLDWFAAGDVLEGPVCRGIDRHGNVRLSRLHPRYVNRNIKRRCEQAGFPGITCHALRRGMAESLSQSGANTTDIMRAGRWRSSEMPLRYTRGIAAGEGAVARFWQKRLDGSDDDPVEVER
ncbi:MAG: tyrosine-type recombinase/integrase [Chloroflexi bacterium]|nr:tyrosine-type recombinase/integrase [Chloroflexota bacterium]